jgi:hypothetical protein
MAAALIEQRQLFVALVFRIELITRMRLSVAPGCWRLLRVWLLLLSAVALARAEYQPEELIAKSSAAHAQLGRFSMMIWTRSFDWFDGGFSR